MADVNGLYVLQDGTNASPGDCKAGKDGVLRHKNGLAVSVDADGNPVTVGSEAERNYSKAAAEAGKDGASAVIKPIDEGSDDGDAADTAAASEARTGNATKPAKADERD